VNLSDANSLESVKKWIDEYDAANSTNKSKVLIGTMSDKRVITYEEAKLEADAHGIPYFETSSKENTGIQEVFTYLAKKLSG